MMVKVFLHWKSEKLALNGLVLHAELDKITIPLKTFTKRRFVQHHLLTQLKLDFCIGKKLNRVGFQFKIVTKVLLFVMFIFQIIQE